MKPLPALADIRRVAILRLSSLGDIVLTLPVVGALRRALPEARLAYWTKEEYRDLVRFDPRLDHVRVLDRDARRLEDLVSMSAELEDQDVIVDLHGSVRTRVLTLRQRAPVLRAPGDRLVRERWVHARWTKPQPARHAVERYAAALRPLGIDVAGVPEMVAGVEAEAWAGEWLAGWTKQAPLALCPGARHFTKRWPERHWLALHGHLRAAGLPLLYLSIEPERRALSELARHVGLDAGARWCTEPIPRMAALLSSCRAAVTCDSGLMHLAAARGRRVVALFGSTAPELGFAPAGEGHVVLCRHEPCQPCTLHGREVCPKGHFRCMNELSPEAVRDAVLRVATR